MHNYSKSNVHVAAGALLVLAVTSTIILLRSRNERKRLEIPYEPGTIAAAVCLGAGTNLGRLLAHQPTNLEQALQGRYLYYDPQTRQIYIEEEVVA